MISFISLFEIFSALVSNPKYFFWIDVFVTDAIAINLNGIKMFLATCVSTFLINGKQANINGLINFIISSFGLLIILAVHFDEIPQFSKDFMTFKAN